MIEPIHVWCSQQIEKVLSWWNFHTANAINAQVSDENSRERQISLIHSLLFWFDCRKYRTFQGERFNEFEGKQREIQNLFAISFNWDPLLAVS